MKQLVADLDRFDDEWQRLAEAGACDGYGSGEYRRVRAEWLEVERPGEVPVATFIRVQANAGPHGD